MGNGSIVEKRRAWWLVSLVIALVALLTLAWFAWRIADPALPETEPTDVATRNALDEPVPDSAGAQIRTETVARADLVPFRGSVVDGETGEPIAGCRVVATHFEWAAETRTDASGAFRLAVDPPRKSSHPSMLGAYSCPRFRYSATGYVTRTLTANVPSRVDAAVLQPVPLQPVAGRLSGRVTGPDGRGIEGVSVESGGGRTATTDARGSYGPMPVPAGFVNVEATGFGWSGCPRRILIDPAPPVREITVDLCLAPATFATATVVDETGSPVVGAEARPSPGGPTLARTDDAGRFRWPLSVADRTMVYVCREGHVSPGDRPRLREGAENRIFLYRGVAIEGRILRADGTPAARVRVRSTVGEWPTEPSITDRDGRFRLACVPARPQVLAVSRFSLGLGSIHCAVSWPGPITGIVHRLPELHAYRFRVLDDATGLPLAGVSIAPRVWRADASMTDESGRGVIEIPRSTPPAVLSRLSKVFLSRTGYRSEAAALESREVETPIRMTRAEAPEEWIERKRSAPGGGHTARVVAFDEAGEPIETAFVVADGVHRADPSGEIRFERRHDRRSQVLTAPGRERVILGGRHPRDLTTPKGIRLRPSAPIHGRLIDDEGRGVFGVRILDGKGQSVVSDPLGRFHFEGHAAGTATMLAIECAFPKMRLEEVWAVAGAPELTVRYPGVGLLRILRPEGFPEGNLQVHVVSTDSREEETGWGRTRRGILGTDAPELVLHARAGPVLVTLAGKVIGFVAAVPATVRPGEVTVIRPSMGSGANFTGRVLGADGKPLRAPLCIAATDQRVAYSDATGRFVLPSKARPFGRVGLSIRYGYHAFHLTGPVHLDGNAPLEIRLVRGGTVLVEVRGHDPASGPARIRMRIEEGPHRPWSRVTGDSTYPLRHVIPGRRTLEVRRPERPPEFHSVSVVDGQKTTIRLSFGSD